MSLTKFRNLNPGINKQKGGPGAGPNDTLSFRKLAVREGHGVSGRSATGARPNRNGHNRKALYDHACNYLSQVMDVAKKGKEFALAPGFRILKEMAAIDHPRDELFIMAIHRDERFKYVIHHSVNVAIYSLAMAEDLGFSKQNKLEVAMAALLHDVGMALIPESILYKQDELSKHEINILRERPNFSYKILRSFGDEYAYLAESAAQVYERVDGSGYPRGMAGDEIHEYAQIIGLLDMYEALIHSRPQREKLTHFTAVKEIIIACKNRFQRKHLKSLLDEAATRQKKN